MERPGIQHMDFNSIFQLYTLKQRKDFGLAHASRLLFMPDALSYLLTGKMVTEYTIASTSQLLNPETRKLDEKLLEVLGVSKSLFADMVEPGAKIGMLTEDLCEELQIEPVPGNCRSRPRYCFCRSGCTGCQQELCLPEFRYMVIDGN